MEIIGTVFCGLGLFFIGFRMISRNLRQLTGTRFKQLIQRATGTRVLSAITGFISGMVSQSAVASVFITTGFHTAGLLSFRQALVIINWANIGTSMLMFVVVFNVKLLILYFIGIIGLAYFLQLDKTNRLQVLFQFLLGLALLFLGVVFIKNGAQQMQTLSWFREALQISSGSLILLFAAGIFLTVAAQSGPTVSVVALTLTSVGLLDLLQAFVVVLGTGIGSAINILLLSVKLKGPGKQLCIYQSVFKTMGALIIGLLILFDYLWSPGENPRLMSMLSVNPAQQVAWLFLIMQIFPAMLLTFVKAPFTALLKKIAPPSADEKMTHPEFLNDFALNDPETALILAQKEQLRLMKMLPDYLVPVSPDREIKHVVNLRLLHESFNIVSQQIVNYLEKLMKNPAATGNQLNILQTQHFSSLLSDFEINLEEFVATINNSFGTIADQSMAVNLIESLRTILETATETYENPDTEGLEMILLLTSDKGNMLQKIRQEYFQKNTSVDIADRQAIYTLTLLFERMYWFLKTMTVIKMKTFPEEHSFSPAIAPMG